MSIQELTYNDLERLAEDKRNIVMRFGEREKLPEHERVPIDQVLDKINRLYNEYHQLRQRHRPITKQKWYHIKKKILQNPEPFFI